MKKVNFRYVFYPFLAFLFGLTCARKLFAGNIEYIIIISVLILAVIGVCIFKKAFKIMAIILSLFAFGSGYYFVGMTQFKVPDYQEKVCVKGRITDSYVDNGYSYSIILDEVKIEGKDAGNIQIKLIGADGMPEIGSFVSFEGNLTSAQAFTLGQFNSYCYRNGVRYFASVKYDDLTIGKGYLKLNERIRLSVAKVLYQNMSRENAGTAYAVLFGDKNNLDEDVQNAYRDAGIVHVLTVSGLHVGFLISLVYGLLKLCRVNKYVCFGVTSAFIFAYAYLCSFSPSVLRAGIMAIVFMLSGLLYRKYDGLNSIGLAGFILCLIRPMMAFDIGFQMSIFCVMSIFILMPPLERVFSRVMPEKVSSLFAISISAQVGILPMLCVMGGQINLLSVFANLIIVPLFSIVYPILFVVAMLSTFIPFLGKLLILLDYIFSGILLVAQFFANGGLSIKLKSMDFAKILIFYLGLFVVSDFVMLLPSKKMFVLALFLLCYAGVFGAYAFQKVDVSPIVYISKYSQDSVILTNKDGVSMAVGDCSLLEKYKEYSGRDIDLFVATESVSPYRCREIEQLGLSKFISYESCYDNVEVISENENYVIAGFEISYLYSEGKLIGTKINFDQRNIFIASDGNLGYNIVKDFDEIYNFDFVFADYTLHDGNFIHISVDEKDCDFSHNSFGNMAFDFIDNKWDVRRID